MKCGFVTINRLLAVKGALGVRRTLSVIPLTHLLYVTQTMLPLASHLLREQCYLSVWHKYSL
jgi:hypothetical protein